MNEIITSLPTKQDGVIPTRRPTTLECIDYPVEVLNVMQSAIKDKTTQSRFDRDIIAGSLTLGIQRFVVEVLENGNFTDPLFLICVTCLVLGIVHLAFAKKQETLIERIIKVHMRYKEE